MTYDELTQAAIECLAKAFSGDNIPSHVVQSAVAVLSMRPVNEDPDKKKA